MDKRSVDERNMNTAWMLKKVLIGKTRPAFPSMKPPCLTQSLTPKFSIID